MLKRKTLPALAALLVMLMMLPCAAGAEDTPVTAAEIAGTWSGDAVRLEDTLGGQSPANISFTLAIAEDGTGTAALSAVSVPVSFKDGVISGSKQLGENVNAFHAAVSRDADKIVIEGEWVLSYTYKSGRVVYAWTASREGGAVAGTQGPEAGEESSEGDDIPVLIGPSPTPKIPEWTPYVERRPPPAPDMVSTCKIGDLYGEVNVRQNDEDDDMYFFAWPGLELYHNDRVRTLRRSGCILSFSDMSTFIMKEDTIIVMDLANERFSKIGMIAGNVWANLKKMVEGGSMEIEMGQAVAGIKGTTLICEEKDGVSTLKVLEGTVEYTSKATGETVSVGGGQMIEATAAGLGKPTAFDIDAEMAAWDETARRITADAIKRNTGGRGIHIIIGAVLALGAVALVLVTVRLYTRGRKRSPVPAAAPHYAPRYCTRCGNAVSPGGAFCPACGARQATPVPAPVSYGRPPKRSSAPLIAGIVAAMLMLGGSAYLLFFAGKGQGTPVSLPTPAKTAEAVAAEPTQKPAAGVDYAATRDVEDLIGVWAGELEYTEISGDWATFPYPVSQGYVQPFMLKIAEGSTDLDWRQAILRIDGGDAVVLNAGFEGRFLEIRGQWQSCDVSISVEYDQARGGFAGIGEYIHFEKHAVFDFFMAAADAAAWDSGNPPAATQPPAQAATVSDQTITVSMAYDSGEGVYSGEVDDEGRPNGRGRFTMQSSDTGRSWSYEGQWAVGEITGEGVMAQDDFIFSGSFLSGLLEGYCEVTDGGILRYEGMCKSGKLHGQGALYTSSGMLLFEGEFQNDMLVESAAARQARAEAFKPECEDMDEALYDGCMAEDNTFGYPVAVWGFPLAMGEQASNGTIILGHMGDDGYPVCLVYRYGVGEPKMAADDWINAWGVVTGLYEYENWDGRMLTCPMIEVVCWDDEQEGL